MENCMICEETLVWEFTIFHGKGACVICGALYAIEGYEGRTETISDLTDKGIELLKEYWKAKHRYLGIGMFMPNKPNNEENKNALHEWIMKNRPDIPKNNK